MIKKLLIGASALALTTTVVHAQSFDPDAVAPGVADLNVSNQIGVGARFENLNQGRPTDAEAVNTADHSRDGFFNTPSRRESASATLTAVDASVPSDQKMNDGDGNKATVDQDGNDNTVKVDQDAGNEGYAVVNQDGNTNRATVLQSENGSGDAGTFSAERSANKALIQQASPTAASGNTALINQLYNEAEPLIASSGVRDSVNDAGSNDAVIIQGDLAAGHLSTGNDASIEQRGTNNEGFVRQGSNQTTNGSLADIDQVGYSNFAAIRQGRSEGFGLNDGARDADILQNGRLHTANIVQLGQGSSTGDIVQNGGLRNQANLVQNGTAQTASILQTDGDYNSAYVEQSLFADNSTAKIEQRGGIENYVELFQNADTVDADILQRGGNGNVAVVTQNVAQSNTHIDTNGNNNNVTINQ